MARPKKVSSKDMLRILDSYLETHGDVSKLKCSLLEEYAGTIGIAVKAYDFRRDEAVRRRIDELNAEAANKTVGAVAYKNLDTDAFISNHPTRATLKAALSELDAHWRRVFEQSVSLKTANTSLLAEKNAKKTAIEELTDEITDLQAQLKTSKRIQNEQIVEIRYLKAALETYLYPAVANEILLRGGAIKQAGTEVTDAAMELFVSAENPDSTDNIAADDTKVLSRGQELFTRMQKQIEEGSKN